MARLARILDDLQAWLRLTPFGRAECHRLVHRIAGLAQQADRGSLLATALVEVLRQQCISARLA